MTDTPDPALAILAAIVAALRADAPLAALFPGDELNLATEGASRDDGTTVYPLLELGAIQVVSTERISVDDEDEDTLDDPSEAFFDLHAYSRARDDGTGGRVEAMKVLNRTRRIFGRQDLTFDGEDGAFRLVLAEIQTTRHFVDADSTAHSVQTVRFEVEPTEG